MQKQLTLTKTSNLAGLNRVLSYIMLNDKK